MDERDIKHTREPKEVKHVFSKAKQFLNEQAEGIPYGGKHLFFTVILTFIVVAVSCVAVFFASLQGAEQVMVPDVVGKTLTNALLEMQQKELYAKIQLRYTDNMEDAGTILEQSPAPGSIVKAYRRVTLTVSRGAALDYIEDFSGKQIDTALSQLEQNAKPLLSVAKPVYKKHSSPKGTILAQTPAAGTYINDRLNLQFIVSSGPDNETVQIPSLEGKDIAQTLKIMSSSHVIFDFTSHETFAGEKGNTVTAQDIADQEANAWTHVTADFAFSPAKEKDKTVHGIFSCKTPTFPYPVNMQLIASTKEGKKTTIANFQHDGGNVTVPYDVEKGTNLTLYAVEQEMFEKHID